MRSFIIFTLTISICLVAGGCGSSKAQKTTASPTPVSTNANAVRVESPNTSGPEANPSANAADPNTPRRSRLRERVDIDPTATPLPLRFEKASEDSEYAITMDRSGAVIETRVFHKHQQLQKVEMKWTDSKGKTLRAQLKNGKTVESKTDRISTLRSASSTELLEVLGVKGKRGAKDRPKN